MSNSQGRLSIGTPEIISDAEKIIVDGNEAAVDVAYRLNEVMAIYPITPATSMGELADEWSAKGRKNIWNTVPVVAEMQSEGGVSGALHGATQTGALTTTFTSSQGLLLMIPNLYRISAELSPTVIHVASRAVASQGMTIYVEHSDVMATRATGFGLLCSSNVQEAHDMALLSQLVSFKTRVPFIHFFDGMRTSHEVTAISRLSDEQLKEFTDENDIHLHRERRLDPNHPVARGTIQNADMYFQGRETVNPNYQSIPGIFEENFKRFQEEIGREYHVVEYTGDPKAEWIIILMGSGAETAIETVEYLCARGEKIGVLKIRLFQPFPVEYFLNTLPKTVRSIAVLDRTKEPGSAGEPLYQTICTTLMSGWKNLHPKLDPPTVIGGRFGLAGKEFTPAMVKRIFEELASAKPKNNFVIGIEDDLTHASLSYDPHWEIEEPSVTKAIFYGLGADGTVSANKNTIKIIGSQTDHYIQAYFLFDPKKSGSKTISHLRFGPKPIRSEYLIQSASFLACHQFHFLERINVLASAAPEATFLLNSPYSPEETWAHLPRTIQEEIITKKLKVYVIDAYRVAKLCGLGPRMNTIMQTCFFALTHIIPLETAIKEIKATIQDAYSHKGQKVVEQNFAAVDQAIENLHPLPIPSKVTSQVDMWTAVNDRMDTFDRQVTAPMIMNEGDNLPTSRIPNDGSFPTHTARWEKRNISMEVPEWNPDACIQCGRCSFVCPHAVIRVKQLKEQHLVGAPEGFKKALLKNKNGSEATYYALQPSVEDCTGCGLCEEACPVKGKAIHLVPKAPILEREKENIAFFEKLPYTSAEKVEKKAVPGVQYLQPLFEFSGACAGCGEAPYVRLLSQLFGDRTIIANACGCSSVFGGTLPTVPWAKNAEGRGPAWSSSLFEDNAEFGFGFLLTANKHREMAAELLKQLSDKVGESLVESILNASQKTESEIAEQRKRIDLLQERLSQMDSDEARSLKDLAPYFVAHSIWTIGGDGWAYDIGFGGLDHVLATGQKARLLVLDTEVYSNTGGQSSKASPRGSVVKFASHGKPTAKKDLGLMAITYGHAYVAQVAFGSNPNQTLQAFLEAESFEGPSLIIAYSPCIAHGIDMRKHLEQQARAVKSGYWPLYRYNPSLEAQGKNPMQLDSQPASIPLEEYMQCENRFRILKEQDPETYKALLSLAESDVKRKWKQYERLARNDK